MRVAVVGTGRVGVPTAASLAAQGHEVVGTDLDEAKLARLAQGSVPFHEPGLEELVREMIDAGRLSFSTDLASAVDGARAVFVCVGTPAGPSGAADLSAVEAVAAQLAHQVSGAMTVVVKSTVPVGTSERVASILGGSRSGRFQVAANPEFLREGKAVADSLRPIRIVVGTDSPEAGAVMRELYGPLLEQGIPLIETDPRTAELTKLACNAFLATKISYMNAVARMCEAAGADVSMIAVAMGLDERIGPAYLEAGLGYGGYCLPKDVRAFERVAEELGYDFGLIREVDRVNTEVVTAVFDRVRSTVGELEGRRIALLGLAFKPGTDNVTSAPALALARLLLDAGASVAGYDPQAGASAKAAMPEVEVAGDPYAALEGASCAVVCTEWDEIRTLDLGRIRELMAAPILVDGRNVFQPGEVTGAGITYLPTGRPSASPSG